MSEYNEYIYRRTREPWGWSAENTGEQIVRCRDCRAMRVKYGNTGIECWMNGEPFTVEPDGFCKWGKRRAEQ